MNSSTSLDQPHLYSISAGGWPCLCHVRASGRKHKPFTHRLRGTSENRTFSSLPHSVRVPVRKTVTKMLPHPASMATLGLVSQDRPGWLVSGLDKRGHRIYMESTSSGISDRY